MKPFLVVLAALTAAGMVVGCATDGEEEGQSRRAGTADTTTPASSVDLPEPSATEVSLEEAIGRRRSVREYTADPLTVPEVGQLLWAAQGVTSEDGGRSAPSAGALYPLEVFLVAREVEGIDPGVWRYEPEGHRLSLVEDGDRTAALGAASLGQESVADAPASLVIAGVSDRTTGKYGERGERYVVLEAGHAAQNLALQAVALDLGVVTLGAFDDGEVREVLGLEDDEEPLYVIPVGRPAE